MYPAVSLAIAKAARHTNPAPGHLLLEEDSLRARRQHRTATRDVRHAKPFVFESCVWYRERESFHHDVDDARQRIALVAAGEPERDSANY